jgi:hypothetical protein
MKIGGEEEVICCPTLRGASHPGHDVTGNRPFASDPSSKSLAGERDRHLGDDVEVGDANVLECDPSASPPQTFRRITQQRRCGPLGQPVVPPPDRFLEQAHCDPGGNAQRFGFRLLVGSANGKGQVLAVFRKEIGIAHIILLFANEEEDEELQSHH